MSSRRTPGRAMRHLGRLVADRCDSGRLVRGHELFDDGMVDGLTVERGVITAQVYGSRSDAYEVEIRVPTDTVLPTDPYDLRFECTCPDWGDPCKHGVAVLLAYAEHVDEIAQYDVEGAGDDGTDRVGGMVEAGRGPPHDTRGKRDANALGSPTRTTSVPSPTVRPAWADDLAEPPAPTTLAAWLGDPSVLAPADDFVPDVDPEALLYELGPCRVDDGGPDLAPILTRLIIHRYGENDP